MPAAESRAQTPTKPRRGRARRVAKWAGLVACVALAAAWVWSGWYESWAQYVPGPSRPDWICIVRVGRGGVEVYAGDTGGWSPPNPGLSTGCWQYAAGMFDAPESMFPKFYAEHSAGKSFFVVPIWVVLAPLALVTPLLWYADRLSARRRRAGLCVKCGYDRAGLDAGARCPECGAAGSGAVNAKT